MFAVADPPRVPYTSLRGPGTLDVLPLLLALSLGLLLLLSLLVLLLALSLGLLLLLLLLLLRLAQSLLPGHAVDLTMRLLIELAKRAGLCWDKHGTRCVTAMRMKGRHA